MKTALQSSLQPGSPSPLRVFLCALSAFAVEIFPSLEPRVHRVIKTASSVVMIPVIP